MNTKDWSRMVGSDTPPRVPEEFVRYDEDGSVPGSLPEVSSADNGKHLVVVNGVWTPTENTQAGLVITASTQTTVDDLTVPLLSAEDVTNIANAIKEGKSVSIYDATADVYFVPMMADWSETAPSFCMLFYWLAIVDYQITEGDTVAVSAHKFYTPAV